VFISVAFTYKMSTLLLYALLAGSSFAADTNMYNALPIFLDVILTKYLAVRVLIYPQMAKMVLVEQILSTLASEFPVVLAS
jgi:hypothetical protein